MTDPYVELVERLRTVKLLSQRNQYALQAEAADAITRLRASVEQMAACLEAFATFAETFVDDDGWTGSMKQERIVDWFGPTDFRLARHRLSSTPIAEPTHLDRMAARLGAKWVPYSEMEATPLTIAEAMKAALEAWKALPEDERNGERPWIMGWNAGYEHAQEEMAEGADPVLVEKVVDAINDMLREKLNHWLSRSRGSIPTPDTELAFKVYTAVLDAKGRAIVAVRRALSQVPDPALVRDEGYRQGIEDAAKVADVVWTEYAKEPVDWYYGGQEAAVGIAARIRALASKEPEA